MKINIKRRPQQFTLTEVTCLDSIMVEMLNCTPDIQREYTVADIDQHRALQSNVGFLFVFNSGAGLVVGRNINKFYIHCFMPDGSDVVSAASELEMLDSFRIARKHFITMKQTCNTPVLNALQFRITRY